MYELLLTVSLLAYQGTERVDVEHIESKAGTSAAVIVADSVPLVHTQQIMADTLDPTVKRLEAVLKGAGSSLDRIVKLNFVVTGDEQQEPLRKELARGTFGNSKPA